MAANVHLPFMGFKMEGRFQMHALLVLHARSLLEEDG
jgi:hypothetical protein